MQVRKHQDLTGMKFGKLTVICENGRNNNGSVLWFCQCDCNGPNSNINVTTGNLKSGNTKSCGCLFSKNHLKRGDSNGPFYITWADMMARCYNPNNTYYCNYGERGIKVCDEWQNYYGFVEWAENTKTDPNTTLDRINNNLGYEPNNCKWSTHAEQMKNRCNTVFYDFSDERHTLGEWCEIFGLPYFLIYQRIHRYNMDFWTAISTPLPDHYYEDCYDYDYSNEYYEDPYEYDNYIYDE